jgi:hypothetical protein
MRMRISCWIPEVTGTHSEYYFMLDTRGETHTHSEYHFMLDTRGDTHKHTQIHTLRISFHAGYQR